MRRMAGRFADEGRCRPCRGTSHGRQSGCFAERIVDPKAKTVLVYGHYDVMPVDPVDEWRTSPFEPVVKDGRIWCRGADDDKGQLFMHAKAFEARCATDSLPCK